MQQPRFIPLFLPLLGALGIFSFFTPSTPAADITIDATRNGRMQTIDGFGTCHSNPMSAQPWYQRHYYDDLGATIVRLDLTPRFKSPWSDLHYYSPWFMGSQTRSVFNLEDQSNPNGPENNRVRTYRSPQDYSRLFGGKHAPIAVMGEDIDANQQFFNYDGLEHFRQLIDAGKQRHPDDFKLIGSIWSPAPWVKESNGQTWNQGGWPQPVNGTPFPFIWGGNFAGGRLDTSGKPLDIFHDGTAPTSALTQFARGTAAYIKGLQDTFGTRFYAISIQNEVNFPEFYNSCVYRTSEEYIKALKTIRAEFNRHPDLRSIRIMGPEDVLGGDIWGLWQYGGGDTATHKSLQYLRNIARDPEALGALDFVCIHGYAADGATAAGADSTLWRWYADGWTTPPAQGIPANIKGFSAYNKKSWMTETSGESNRWLDPDPGFPGNGAWSIAFKTQQALTAGRQSAILYWQFAERKNETTPSCLTQERNPATQPKYIAAKHFFKFIRPGAVALKTTSDDPDGITASSYWHDQDQALTIVLVNRSADARPATLHLPPLGRADSLRTFTSSQRALWQPSATPITRQSATLTIPGYGITTLTTLPD